jgi:hypothetical protein
MSATSKKAYLGAGAVLVVALVVGVSLALTAGSTVAPPTHQAYAQLFANAEIGRAKVTVLSTWPKPYQVYHDAYFHHCYEWWDKPVALYSLCFDPKSGTLVNKDIL